MITKNAIVKIAEEFSANVKASAKSTTITHIDNEVVTIDSAAVFRKDENVKVFHSIGSVKGIADVKLPIADAKISDNDSSKAKILFNQKVNIGDELVSETLGINSQEKLLSFGDAVMLPGEKLSQFDTISRYIIAQNSKYNCIIWDDVKNGANKTFSSSLGFEKNLDMTTPKSSLKVVPYYQVQLKDEKCNDEDGKMCRNLYNVYTEVKVYESVSDAVLFSGAYEVDVIIRYPKNDKSNKIDYELTEEALKLLAKATKDIKL